MSGGSDKTTYYASFGMSNNNGTAKGNDSKNYQGSVNVTTIFWDRLRFSAKVAGSVAKTKGFHGSVQPYSYASTTSRVISAFDDNGDLYYYKNANKFRYNILNELAGTGNENTSNSLNANISLNLDILRGLKYEMSIGYSYTSSHGQSWATERTYYITAKSGSEFGQYMSLIHI